MRRGGRLILLLGVLIAALVAVGVIFFLQQQAASPTTGPLLPPTTEPTRRVVVARVDIPRNTLLTDTVSLLDYADISEAVFNANANQYFSNTSELAGKVTIGTISVTTPILTSDVTDAGLSVQIPPATQGQPRTKAISVLINNLTGVADEIKPGDFVDILSSFQVQRTYLRPGFNDQGEIRFVEEQFTGLTTKSLIQNVQVLRIKRPEVLPSGTGTPTAQADQGQLDASGQPVQPASDGNPPTSGSAPSAANGSAITPGSWLLVLAMTDQQAEILKFSREQGTGITLVLRGRGDTAIENTRGATLDILVGSFGLPLPNPAVPAVSQENSLTPLPTTTPAPTPTP